MWSQRAIACQFSLLKELKRILSQVYTCGLYRHDSKTKSEKDIWGCKILGTFYFKNALVDFFKSCQGKGNGLTIITLEDYNRLLLDFETEFPCHRYSVAKEAAMSTKHALKLSSMLDKYVVISFLYPNLVWSLWFVTVIYVYEFLKYCLKNKYKILNFELDKKDISYRRSLPLP